MERRDFLKWSIGAGALAVVGLTGFGCSREKATGKAMTLPPLPYEKDALEPYVSAATVQVHFEKHHQGYVNKMNALVQGTPYQGKGLAEIILGTADNPGQQALFNNAAQVFNHTFYWNSMAPIGGGRPMGELGTLIDETYGNFDTFCTRFIQAAASQFGSGWVWLVKAKSGLRIITTPNADTPVAQGQIPLITLDVWEHAYYLDYQNRRLDYTKAFLQHLVNWEFAEMNLA